MTASTSSMLRTNLSNAAASSRVRTHPVSQTQPLRPFELFAHHLEHLRECRKRQHARIPRLVLQRVVKRGAPVGGGVFGGGAFWADAATEMASRVAATSVTMQREKFMSAPAERPAVTILAAVYASLGYAIMSNNASAAHGLTGARWSVRGLATDNCHSFRKCNNVQGIFRGVEVRARYHLPSCK